MNQRMIEQLKKLAQSECFYDYEDGNISDYDVDDAFYTGESAGKVMLARDVLTAMNIDWASP